MNNNEVDKVVYLRLDDIIPNRFQPREIFDETGLEELASSIKEHGVIQPVIVRKLGDKYELIAGERRSKASALAGLTTIPAIIRNMDDKESAKVSLLENLQRKNLSAIEEARTYKRILELDNMTQEDLAKTMGKSQPLVANKLRLLSLPEEVQDALIKNQISERHARSLLNVKNKETQLMLLERIKKERLTVRELDSEIKKMQQEQSQNQNLNNLENSLGGNTSNMDFNNFSSNNQSANYQDSFGNMGLNDYRSQVNNNMFNNIPSASNYQDFSNQFTNIPNEEINTPTTNYSEFGEKNNNIKNDYNSNNMYSNDYQPVNSQIQEMNNNSSLGSMFDNNNEVPAEHSSAPNDNQNVFISHIKENEMQKQGNQFLPNFDEIPFMNNESPISNSFDNSNNLDKFNNSPSEFNSNLENFNNVSNDFNQLYNTTSNINNDYQYDTSINSNQNYGFKEFNQNQGALFNQQLNIVDVPMNKSNSSEDEKINNYQDSNSNSNSYETDKIDNTFDEQYENILFTKPVPIQQEEPKDNDYYQEDKNSDNVELIDNHINKELLKDENKYISLEPEKTIFDTKGAVLELKKTTDRIKQNEINIDTEEIDFDDYYQIIIKIKKEI